jgi:hypothetical protein
MPRSPAGDFSGLILIFSSRAPHLRKTNCDPNGIRNRLEDFALLRDFDGSLQESAR